MTIAFFDSGIGGLTVLHRAMRELPAKRFVYFADTLHVPYGTKPKEQVRNYILSSVRTLTAQPVEALVVACNTATSIAIRDLRASYDMPVIGMEPAVKPAVERERRSGKRVLVVATPLTLRESKYHELVKRVDDRSIVDSLPLPELVEFCEALDFDGPAVRDYLQSRLSAYPLDDYGTIVLGCTHFPFYRKLFAELLPKHIRVIDGSEGTVKRLREMLSGGANVPDADRPGDVTFVCSGGDRAYIRKMERALAYLSDEAEPAGDGTC